MYLQLHVQLHLLYTIYNLHCTLFALYEYSTCPKASEQGVHYTCAYDIDSTI